MSNSSVVPILLGMAKKASKKKAVAATAGAASLAGGVAGAVNRLDKAHALNHLAGLDRHVANQQHVLGNELATEALRMRAAKFAQKSRKSTVGAGAALGAGVAGAAGAAYYYRHVNGKTVKVHKRQGRASRRIPSNFTNK